MKCQTKMEYKKGGFIPSITVCQRKKLQFLKTASNVVVREGTWSESNKRIKTHALFVYSNITHDGHAYITDNADLEIVATTSNLQGPFYTDSNSIEPLNYKPFWFPKQGIGGYKIIDSWWRPNQGDLKLLLDMLKRNNDSIPPLLTPHTLVLHVKFVRYGGEPEDSKVILKGVYVAY